MAANGRGALRPNTGSKTPPFIIVGLLIVTGILAFNYWTASSKNYLLNTENEELGIKYRSTQTKRQELETRNNEYQQEINKLQQSIRDKQQGLDDAGRKDQEQVDKIDKLAQEMDTLRNDLNTCDDEVGFCHENVTRMIIANRNQIGEIQSKCRQDVDEARSHGEQRAASVESDCQAAVDQKRLAVLRAVQQVFGTKAITLLKEQAQQDISGIDLTVQTEQDKLQNQQQQLPQQQVQQQIPQQQQQIDQSQVAQQQPQESQQQQQQQQQVDQNQQVQPPPDQQQQQEQQQSQQQDKLNPPQVADRFPSLRVNPGSYVAQGQVISDTRNQQVPYPQDVNNPTLYNGMPAVSQQNDIHSPIDQNVGIQAPINGLPVEQNILSLASRERSTGVIAPIEQNIIPQNPAPYGQNLPNQPQLPNQPEQREGSVENVPVNPAVGVEQSRYLEKVAQQAPVGQSLGDQTLAKADTFEDQPVEAQRRQIYYKQKSGEVPEGKAQLGDKEIRPLDQSQPGDNQGIQPLGQALGVDNEIRPLEPARLRDNQGIQPLGQAQVGDIKQIKPQDQSEQQRDQDMYVAGGAPRGIEVIDSHPQQAPVGQVPYQASDEIEVNDRNQALQFEQHQDAQISNNIRQ